MSNAQNDDPNQAATLAVIAGLITTLGDGLATVAAALALQEAQQTSSNDLEAVQQQLRVLTKEIRKIKRVLNMP